MEVQTFKKLKQKADVLFLQGELRIPEALLYAWLQNSDSSQNELEFGWFWKNYRGSKTKKKSGGRQRWCAAGREI